MTRDMESPGFADRLAALVQARGNPVCVGLDPRWEQLPPSLRGTDAGPTARAEAYQAFCQAVIEVVAPLVPAVKPQVAFFEQLGPPGMQALVAVIAAAREAGLMVIADGKRNDIGSTAEAYADAWLGPPGTSAWGADALTVSPYLGSDSLAPFVTTAQARGAGVFVLVKTSNPGGGELQDMRDDGWAVYDRVAQRVESLAGSSLGECGFGAVGAVVGATYPAQLAELRRAMPRAWLLVPGYGHQGGGAADVAGAFDARGLGGLINNARGIIFAHGRREYAERFGAERWQDAVAEATRAMIAELRTDTLAGRLSPPGLA